jgi:hypothetical protein
MNGMEEEDTGVKFKAIEELYVHLLSPPLPHLVTCHNPRIMPWKPETFGNNGDVLNNPATALISTLLFCKQSHTQQNIY